MSVLSFIREQEPGFNDVPDDKLVEFIVQNQPEFLQDKQFRRQARSFLGQQSNQDASTEQLRSELDSENPWNPALGTAIGRAATRGTASIVSSLASAGDAVDAFARNIGIPANPLQELSARGRGAVRSFISGGQQIPAEGPASFSEAQGAGQTAAYLLERGIGEQIPQFVASVVTGGAGVLAGLSPKAASLVAVLATTFPQEMGGAFEEIKQATGKEAPLTAAGVGAINSFLETIGDAKIIERALGGDQIVGATIGKYIKNLAKRSAVQGAKEFGTEAGQELVTALAPMTQGAPMPEGLGQRVLDAGILGAVGGAGFGGGVDLAQGIQDVGGALLPETTAGRDRRRFFAGQAAATVPGRDQVTEYTAPQQVSTPDVIGLNGDISGFTQPAPFSALPQTQNIPSSLAPSEIADIPEFAVNIPPEIKQQVQREGMTFAQRSALEMMDRLDSERNAAAAEAQQLEQQGKPGLANLRFAQGLNNQLDMILALGQRLSQPIPSITPQIQTDQGLNEAAPSTITPSVVDMALMGQRTGPVAPIQTDQGLTEGVAPTIAPTPLDALVMGSRQTPTEPLGTTPAQPVAAGEKLRQAGSPNAEIKMTPSRIESMREMDALPLEEKDEAEKHDPETGKPTGNVQTNAGHALAQILAANTIIRSMAKAQGVVLDSDSEFALERRYQEQALNQYEKTKETQLGFPQLFNRKQAFRAALKDVSRQRNSAGTERGNVTSLTIQTPSGDEIVNPAVEAPKSTAPEIFPAAQNPVIEGSVEARKGSVLDFLDQFDSPSQRNAATNLIAEALGLAKPVGGNSPKRLAFENDPTFQQQVRAFAKTIDRNSIGSLTQTPLSVADVHAFAQKVLPDLTPVQIVSDPTITQKDRNGDDVPVRGLYRPDQQQPFILNAAFLGSENDVRDALHEELFHNVYGDAEVQAAFDEVKASLTPEEIEAQSDYAPEVRVEEAAIQKVIQEINTATPESAVGRFIQKVLDAIKRLFGVSQTPARQILARALKAASQGIINGVDTRNSLARGYWKNLKDVTADATGAGDPDAIRAAAFVQAESIPKQYVAEVNNLGTTRKDEVTKSLLKTITSAEEMSAQLAGSFALSPLSVNFGGTSIPSGVLDIAAEVVLKQNLVLKNQQTKLLQRQQEVSEKLGEAMARQFPERAIAENGVQLYRGAADNLVADYKDYLKNQVLTNTKNFDAEIQKQLNAASEHVTTEYEQIGNAVAVGLKQIAKEIPDSALTTAQSAQAWIGERLSDPRLPKLMSEEARDWLLQPVGRKYPPLVQDKRIHERLAAIKDIAGDNAHALTEIKDFQKQAFKTSREVGPRQFAEKWSKLRDKYKASLATLKEIDRNIARLDANYEGTVQAKEILDRLLSDPAHQSPVDEAVKHLQAESNVRVYGKKDNGQYTGEINYVNPLTEKIVTIDLQPDVGTEQANLQKIQQLRSDVATWMQTTDDRVKRAAWEKEDDFLQRYAFGISPAIVTGSSVFGYRLPSGFQLNPFSRQLWAGFMDVRGPAYERIGNRLIQPADQASVVYGQVDRALRTLSENHALPTAKAAVAAARSHGWTTNAGNREAVLGRWQNEIFNPLVSQNQNPTANPYKVGDFINGVELTKEDFAAADAFKARDTELFDLLQKAEKTGNKPLLYFHPLHTAEQFLGEPLSRRSVDYGLKMPRRPLSRGDERGRRFTEAWLKNTAGATGQHAMLSDLDTYNWVLMGNGLLGNTDKEFNAGFTKEDAELVKKIQQMARANTLPFSDLDGLIQWAGQQQANPTRTEAEAAAAFQLRLLGYVDSMVRRFDKSLNIVPEKTLEDFKKRAIPPGVIDTVGVGESPFLTPRGTLAAAPSFYTYSTVDDGAWGALTAGVRVVLSLREIEAVSTAKAAIDKEVERYDAKDTGEIDRLKAKLAAAKEKSWGPYSPKNRIARSSRLLAEQGKLQYDYRVLKANQQSLDRILTGLERTAKEHVTHRDDSETVQWMRGIRQGFTSQLLSSIMSISNNAGGGTVSNMLFRRGLGRNSYINSVVSIPAQNIRYVFDNALSKIGRMKGMDPVVRGMLKTPGFRMLAEKLILEAVRWEQNRNEAVEAGLIDPPSSRDKAELARLFPETGGRLSESDPNAFAATFSNILSLTPGLKRGLEAAKAIFPGAADRMINQGTIPATREIINSMTEQLNSLWKLRDNGQPGWDDLASPTNRFTAAEFGLPSETAMTFWRRMLSSVGGLEALSLDQYKRSKASGSQEPMLTDGQIQSVAQDIARITNMGSAENTPLISQGRGIPGEFRKWLLMLSRFLVNFNAVMENRAGKVYGDNSRGAKLWSMQSAAVAFLLVVLTTSLWREFGQEARELITGDPRTTTSIGTILEDPSVGDLAKYMGISLASVAPFLGERVAQAFGGTSNKPLLDATRMVAPLGLVADLEQAATHIFQTGDMTYPIADLVRRYVPLSGAVLNRVMPGEQEAREASRATRLAAPVDMEQRQGGGGVSRQTPQTPLLRKAVDLALSGDKAGSEKALAEAAQLRVDAGATPQEAQRAVQAAFQSRDPERSTFGRTLQPEERRRLLARMSPSQRNAFNRARSAFSGKPKKLKLSSATRRRSLLARKQRA
jgi:hypothetical protein